MNPQVKNLVWTGLFLSLGGLLVVYSNFFYVPELTKNYCNEDQYIEQVHSRMGTESASYETYQERQKAILREVKQKWCICVGWARLLPEFVILFLVGAGIAYGVHSSYWYLYLLSAPFVATVYRLLYTPHEMPAGDSMFQYAWYYALTLASFLAALIGGYLVKRFFSEPPPEDAEADDSAKDEPVKWWFYFNEEVSDEPFTKEQLLHHPVYHDDLQVCRIDEETWRKASDDTLLQEPTGSQDSHFVSNRSLEYTEYSMVILSLLLIFLAGDAWSTQLQTQLTKAFQSFDPVKFEKWCQPSKATQKKAKNKLNKKEVNFSLETFKTKWKDRTKNHKLIRTFLKAGILTETFSQAFQGNLISSKAKNLNFLHWAASEGNPELVKKSQDCFDVNTAAQNGVTALHLAVYSGKPAVVQYLHQAGADINAESESSIQPLHVAMYYTRLESAKYLIRNGADVNAKVTLTSRGIEFTITPLSLADEFRTDDVKKLLKEHGAQAD